VSSGTWKTRDGRVLLISEMGTRHIQNAVAMLERMIDYLDVGIGEAYAFSPDSMASYYACQWADDAAVETGLLMRKKRELEAELRRRP
jgi:hypothetical protein